LAAKELELDDDVHFCKAVQFKLEALQFKLDTASLLERNTVLANI